MHVIEHVGPSRSVAKTVGRSLGDRRAHGEVVGEVDAAGKLLERRIFLGAELLPDQSGQSVDIGAGCRHQAAPVRFGRVFSMPTAIEARKYRRSSIP